jgi:serine/threonine-protein phosphatase 2A regulatory subunit B'
MLKGLLKTTTKPKPVATGPGGIPAAPLPSPPSGGATAGAGSAASAPSSMMSGGGAIGLSGSSSASSVGGVGGMPYASNHGIEPTPRADVALPHHSASVHKRERRRSSVVREERAAIVRELPALKDCPPAKREALFKQKLALCSVIFEWDPAEAAAAAAAAAGGVPPPAPTGSEADIRAKEIKRLTLLELVEHVNSPGGQKLFTDAACEDVIAMVSANIFRTLPAPQVPPGGEEVTGSGGGGGEDGEEEPNMEPSWPHLQLVYELLLRFIVSPEVKAKTAKKWIDGNFCTRFIEMFDSEDPRERDYLKTILHRIYGKFMSHRSLIRKAISHVFYRFVYETEKHAGVGELLEILGSIINGFALPLKPEHVTFLERALIPLHHPRSIASYFQQLCYW